MEEAGRGVIFVGGAPRSGTTVAHAIICTSPRVNGYVAESSFLTYYFRALVAGLRQFDNHTRSFFAHKSHFERFARGMVRHALDRVAINVGSPEILALKDPLMTPIFPMLSPLYPAFKFVITVRHPLDVYRSRRAVLQKEKPDAEIGVNEARMVAEEYVRSYAYRKAPNMHFMRYEDMGTEEAVRELGAFLGLDDFDLSRMWERPGGVRVEPITDSANPWHSPLYGSGIQQSTRHKDVVLDPAEAETVLRITRTLMKRFGYDE
jgi:hypothetical protein